jgi:cyclohexyl-isocyanide hydratase
MKIVMLAYPDMTPLDLMGPLQAWSIWPGTDIQVVWKTLEPIPTDTGMAILPTHTLIDAEAAPDILFVGGGTAGTFRILEDPEIIEFLKTTGARANWITSVCTGALVLGAAGLLQGYKATTHWAAVELLAAYGAQHTEGRYVIDRNRATGGGVTAGIDFGLALMAEMGFEEQAKVVQLAMEYSPQPPFASGTPEEASAETVSAVLAAFAS